MKQFLTILLVLKIVAGLMGGYGKAVPDVADFSAQAGSATEGAAETITDPLPGTGKHYIITTDTTYPPFEYTDEAGNFVGIDVDILAAIAEDQGFTYDLNSLGWDSAIAACQAGQADGMIAAVTITEERKANGWIFSDGYYQETQCMAVAASSDIAGFADLPGHIVAVISGSESATYAESLQGQYGFEITYMEDSSAMYQAVTSGQVDACFEDTSFMADTIKRGEPLKIIEDSESEGFPYAFAVFRADKQELIDLFNAGLANIKANGKYDEILAKYLS